MVCWTTYVLKPKPGAGFHFGLRGLEQEDSAPYCPSDTLFAALVATAADLDGPDGAESFAAPFAAGQPPYLLSSAYPTVGQLHLLPVPHRRLNLEIGQGERKLLKQLLYVSPEIFGRALADQPLGLYLGERGAFLQDGRVWLSREEIPLLPDSWRKVAPGALRERRLWQSTAVDRVTVDRVASASSVFQIGRTDYTPNCGLWFAVQWPGAEDPTARTRVETLLTHLGDRGLGGERSVGFGQFTWAAGAAMPDAPEPTAGGAALSLSRYLPRPEELPGALQGSAAYRLVAVSGWLQSPGREARRRRQVRLLTEGSVFQTVGAGPWGRLADVRPAGWDGHAVWRYGYACPVGLGPKEAVDG